MALSLMFPFLKNTSKLKAVKIKGLVLPSFLRTTSTKSTSSITDTSPNVTNTDLTDFRGLAKQKEVLRSLAQTSPDMSKAVSDLNRFAITDAYTIYARTFDGKIDEPATEFAQALAARFDCLPPAYDGFYTQTDLRSTSESLLKQLQWYGAMGSELVLTVGRVPSFIRPVSVKDIKFENQGGKQVPFIPAIGQGNNTYLNSPLFFYTSLDQDVDEAYPVSPLLPAVQPVLFSEEFKNDLRRAFRRAALPRIKAKINTAEFRKSLPAEVQFDEEKMTEYSNALITNLESKLNDMNPEDAIVFFDVLDIEHHSSGNISFHENMRELKELIDSNIAAGAKTLPSILGRGDSQVTASTESMLYLRYVEGLQEKLNSHYSKMFTLALRLLGHDVYVNFKYDDPELRPKSELATFRSMRQSTVLEQLSFGFISDTEASITLTGRIPSGEFSPLSGTRFNVNKTEAENPYSNTSVSGKGVTETKQQKDTKSKQPTGTQRTGGQRSR